MAVAPDGRWIVTGGRRTEVWGAESGTLHGALEGKTASVAVEPGGAWVAVAGGHAVRLWEPPRADSADTGPAARQLTGLAIAGNDTCVVTATGPASTPGDRPP